MTEEEKREIVAQVLEEVAKVAGRSEINVNITRVPPRKPVDADEFERLLRIRAKKIRNGE